MVSVNAGRELWSDPAASGEKKPEEKKFCGTICAAIS